ncbi:hypothetical protein KM043_017188 [Ampulex compressa]|nr:hypothetical protein KM043_017188 [Ampulex compressa]
MKFKKYADITWSLLELSGLLEDEDARVCFEKVKKHYGLHPFHLTNLHAALNEILSSSLNTYDAELKGLILAYKNPKLLTNLGEIVYDACFIHVDIEADFYVFRPEVGCTLKGIVNKKGMDHIGVLVHKAFNVSIPNTESTDEWPGNDVKMGQEIRFTVTHLDFSSGLPFIRGSLDLENYLQGCRLVARANLTSPKSIFDTNDNYDAINKDIVENHNEEVAVQNEEEQVMEENVLKKHIKKKKHLNKMEIVLDEEKKDEDGKRLKKSKKVDKVLKSEMVKALSSKQNHYVDTDDSEGSTTFAKHNIVKVNNSVSINDTIVESEVEDKVLRKSRKKFPQLESEEPVLKIKQEKSVRLKATSENIKQEHSSKKTKTKERSVSDEHLNNTEEQITDGNNVQNFLDKPMKKRSKKYKISESESVQSTLDMNSEKILSKIKTIQETDNEAEVNNTSKNKSKKHKRLRDMDMEESEKESSRVNSPKKQKYDLSVKSCLSEKSLPKIKTIEETDTEAEMNNILRKKSKKRERLIDLDVEEGDIESLAINSLKENSKKSSAYDPMLTPQVVKIKKEKVDSDLHSIQDEDSTRKDVPDANNSGKDRVESKGKNKSAKKSSEIFVQPVEYAYLKDKIKLEKLDDSESERTYKKKLASQHSLNLHHAANEDEPSDTASVKSRSKKSVETDLDSSVLNVKIKTEKSFTNNAVNKEEATSPNYTKCNSQDSVKNTSKKRNKSLSTEHSHKLKVSDPEFEVSNIKIKSERKKCL